MANILISYYKIQEIGLDGINIYWDSLTQELINNGNNVLLINTAYFNKYEENTVGSKQINKYLINKIKEFDPEIIITFNHRIPKSVLDIYKHIPTIIWDGDKLDYFCDLEYIKDNLDRYKIFSMVNNWRSDYIDFGFKGKDIHYMPPATSIKAQIFEQKFNISFLGSIHYNNSNLAKLIKYNNFNDRLRNITQDYIKTNNHNYIELFDKYFRTNNHAYEDEDITEFINSIQETDLFPLFNYRVLTLTNLIDLGLIICGHRWNLLAKIIPQLAITYDSKQVWTLKENEIFYNSSKISISPIHPQAKGSGFPWRVFDIMASNACLVCEHSSDLKALTKDYLDIPMYHTPWEAREICKELLNDDNARKEIVKASQKYIEENARWVHRFKEMENILNIKLINPEEKGRLINLSEDEEFIENCAKYRKKSFGRKISLKNKIRYRIWKHFNKILKKKRIIK